MKAVLALWFLVALARAEFSTNTDAALGGLNSITSGLTADISCLSEVKTQLARMSKTIQDVRDLKVNLGKISNGLNTFSLAMSIIKYAPGIGSAVNALDTTLKALKTPITNAYNRLKTIDAKLYPWKARVDSAKAKLKTAIDDYLKPLKTRVGYGYTAISEAKSCLLTTSSGSTRTTLRGAIETFGGHISTPATTLSTGLGKVGTACSSVKQLTNIAAGWPDLSSILSKVLSFYNTFSPVLDFFAKLKSALSQKVCIPNPWEALMESEKLKEIARAVAEGSREVANAAVEKGKEVAETLEEGREVFRFRRWGRRRRRSLSIKDRKISERDANAMFVSANKRASKYCLSVQDVLNGVTGLLKPLTDLANAAISKVMSALPSFSLPGFPDLSAIFNLNYNFNLPDPLNFDLNFNLYSLWKNVDWNCAVGVKSVCVNGGSLTTTCSSFNVGKRSLIDLNTRFVQELQRILNPPERDLIEVDPNDIKDVHFGDSSFDTSEKFVDLNLDDLNSTPVDDKHLTAEEADKKYAELTEEEKDRVDAMIVKINGEKSTKNGSDETTGEINEEMGNVSEEIGSVGSEGTDESEEAITGTLAEARELLERLLENTKRNETTGTISEEMGSSSEESDSVGSEGTDESEEETNGTLTEVRELLEQLLEY